MARYTPTKILKVATAVYAVSDENAVQPDEASHGRRCFPSRPFGCAVVVMAGVVSVVPPAAVERGVSVLPVVPVRVVLLPVILWLRFWFW